jgi:hypothetical protein
VRTNFSSVAPAIVSQPRVVTPSNLNIDEPSPEVVGPNAREVGAPNGRESNVSWNGKKGTLGADTYKVTYKVISVSEDAPGALARRLL